MRYRLSFTILLALVVIGVLTPQATAQRRRGSDNRSIEQRYFDFMSKGKGTVIVAHLKGWAYFEEFKKETGFSEKTMNKEQFFRYFKFRKKANYDRIVKRAKVKTKEYFDKQDKNRDGQLDVSEMSERLKRFHYKQFDKNGDGKINRSEAEAYVIAYQTNTLRRRGNDQQTNPKRPSKAGVARRIVIEEVDPTRPTVFAIGKLPKDIMNWYTENDIDKDGQVGLYEWRKTGQPVSKFLELDCNSDGLITPDEIVRHQERIVQKNEQASQRSSSSDRRRRYR
ncbi:MAG: hypothetical protein ACFCD0_00280 [Gemmataceae bacterium]